MSETEAGEDVGAGTSAGVVEVENLVRRLTAAVGIRGRITGDGLGPLAQQCVQRLVEAGEAYWLPTPSGGYWLLPRHPPASAAARPEALQCDLTPPLNKLTPPFMDRWGSMAADSRFLGVTLSDYSREELCAIAGFLGYETGLLCRASR